MSGPPEPPGSWGLPLIGATNKVWTDFVGFVREAMGAEENAHPRGKDYGFRCPVFKTAVLGNSVAVVTTDR